MKDDKYYQSLDKRTKEYKDWKSLKKASKIELSTEPEFNIEIKGTENLKEEQLKMSIFDNIPDYLLDEIMKLVSCNCVIEAYDTFIAKPFRVTTQMQDALNLYYFNTFGERLRRTACTSCFKRRLARIRENIISKVNEK